MKLSEAQKAKYPLLIKGSAGQLKVAYGIKEDRDGDWNFVAGTESYANTIGLVENMRSVSKEELIELGIISNTISIEKPSPEEELICSMLYG